MPILHNKNMTNKEKFSDPARNLLRSIVADGDYDLANLSRQMGRNETYLFQFLSKGVPRELKEWDRKSLASTLKIDHTSFIQGSIIKIKSDNGVTPNTVMVPEYGFRAGMGGGGVVLDEKPTRHWPLPQEYLRHVRLDTAALISIAVEGDSMAPTLIPGDQVMINRKDKNPARGGMFAIHDSDTLVVKRIEKIPNSNPVMLRLISDNQNHSVYDVIAEDTNIIGRVVWYARRI